MNALLTLAMFCETPRNYQPQSNAASASYLYSYHLYHGYHKLIIRYYTTTVYLYHIPQAIHNMAISYHTRSPQQPAEGVQNAGGRACGGRVPKPTFRQTRRTRLCVRLGLSRPIHTGTRQHHTFHPTLVPCTGMHVVTPVVWAYGF
jgi:hypothetical protein